jgi:hypothetical protein
MPPQPTAPSIKRQADSNMDKVFGVFALYTAVSCGVVAVAKRLAKGVARRIAVPSPALVRQWVGALSSALRRRGGSGSSAAGAAAPSIGAAGISNLVGGKNGGDKPGWVHPLAKPVAIIADHLLPTQFFGPYLCAYLTAKVLVSTTIARVSAPIVLICVWVRCTRTDVFVVCARVSAQAQPLNAKQPRLNLHQPQRKLKEAANAAAGEIAELGEEALEPAAPQLPQPPKPAATAAGTGRQLAHHNSAPGTMAGTVTEAAAAAAAASISGQQQRSSGGKEKRPASESGVKHHHHHQQQQQQQPPTASGGGQKKKGGSSSAGGSGASGAAAAAQPAAVAAGAADDVWLSGEGAGSEGAGFGDGFARDGGDETGGGEAADDDGLLPTVGTAAKAIRHAAARAHATLAAALPPAPPLLPFASPGVGGGELEEDAGDEAGGEGGGEAGGHEFGDYLTRRPSV